MLINYALERLLYRLAQSVHRERFANATPGLMPDFAVSRQTMWQSFLTRSELTAPPLADVLDELREQRWPLLQAAAKAGAVDKLNAAD